MNPPSPETQVIGLMDLNNKIQKTLSSALSVHGVGVSEFLVLRQLQGAPSQTMRRIDLAQAVGLSASGVTRLLNPMEKLGLVQKEQSPRDARVSLVSLSKAGKRVGRELDVTFANTAKHLLAPMSVENRKTLFDLIGKLS
ncbi:MAG: MarR family winged helix-turn-helix transcriptional regulator [Lysobacterales bacterium]